MKNISLTIIILSIVTVIGFQSCKQNKPERDYFIGTWKSDDGAFIMLNDDSTCLIQHLNYANVFDTLKKINTVSFKGSWKLHGMDIYGRFPITIKDNDLQYQFNLYVRGYEPFFNNPPWYLYAYIGNPNDMTLYQFDKEQD